MWMVPGSDLERRALSACGRKYFHREERDLKTRFVTIQKAMLPLSGGKVSIYPREWVENCMCWFEKINQRKFVPLQGLMTLIEDEDRKNEWIRRYQEVHPPREGYDSDPFRT